MKLTIIDKYIALAKERKCKDKKDFYDFHFLFYLKHIRNNKSCYPWYEFVCPSRYIYHPPFQIVPGSYFECRPSQAVREAGRRINWRFPSEPGLFQKNNYSDLESFHELKNEDKIAFHDYYLYYPYFFASNIVLTLSIVMQKNDVYNKYYETIQDKDQFWFNIYNSALLLEFWPTYAICISINKHKQQIKMHTLVDEDMTDLMYDQHEIEREALFRKLKMTLHNENYNIIRSQ